MSNSDLKLLFDVNIGQRTEVYFKEQGFDSISIRELNPHMTDGDIMDIAVNQKRLIVTQDKDFGELVYYSKRSHYGVLLLRLENTGWQQKIKILAEIFQKHSEELKNSFSVYQDKKLRIRK